MSKDAGERPYTYYFPYLQCPFSQNAIDVKMKLVWTQNQIKLNKESQQKAKAKSWGKATSGVQNFNIN